MNTSSLTRRASMGGMTIDKLKKPGSAPIRSCRSRLPGCSAAGMPNASANLAERLTSGGCRLSNVDVPGDRARALPASSLAPVGKIDLSGSGADAATVKTVGDRTGGRRRRITGQLGPSGMWSSRRRCAKEPPGSEAGGSPDDPFTRLGATLRIANGWHRPTTCDSSRRISHRLNASTERGEPRRQGSAVG